MVRCLLSFGWCGKHCLVIIFLIFGCLQASAADSTYTETCDTTGNKVLCAIADSTGYVWEVHRYKKGMKWGKWQYYNREGQLTQQILYRRNKRIWTFEYRDGEVIQSTNKHGKVKKFKGCGC